MDYSGFEDIKVEVDPKTRVALLTLNRPKVSVVSRIWKK